MKKIIHISVVVILILVSFSCSFGPKYGLPESGFWSTDDGTLTFEIADDGWFGTFKTEDEIIYGYWRKELYRDDLSFSNSLKTSSNEVMQVRIVSLKEDEMVFKVINYPEKLKGKKFVLKKSSDNKYREEVRSAYFDPKYILPESGYWISEDGLLTFKITDEGYLGTFKSGKETFKGKWVRGVADEYFLCPEPDYSVDNALMRIGLLISEKGELFIDGIRSDYYDIKAIDVLLVKQPDNSNDSSTVQS